MDHIQFEHYFLFRSMLRDCLALKFRFADRFPDFADTLSLFADFIFF